jgi:uncharacterized repeat protein (TIGR04076 family)
LKSYILVGKIVKVEGECPARHHVGEEFDLTLFSEEENKTFRTPNICGFFYNAIFPYLVALQFGGAFPWEENKEKYVSRCPDKNKVVVIEIKRVKK